MSSEQLADGVNPLDAELAATWDILKGYSGRNTDLGIARRFGGASAAYSLRDIGALGGAVVRVRRSSDNVEDNFSANQIISGALETFVGASNDGFVEIWYDQSGNFRHAIQETATNQPKIVSSGSLITVNGKPAITFDGNDNFLEVDGSGSAEAYSFSPSGDFGMFVVYKASVGNVVDSRDAGGDGIFLQQSGGSTTRFRYNASANNIDVTATNDAQHFNTMTLDGTTLSGSVDGGTAVTKTVTAGVSTTQNLVLGAGFNEANATDGEIQEAIFYENSVASEKSEIETDIDNFYSIT
jgi:hypothetical protein